MRRIPGIVDAAEGARVGHALQRQLRKIRLAEDHKAGLDIAPHDMRMLSGDDTGQRLAATGRRQAGIVLRAVLDQKRHAGKGAGCEPGQLRARLALHQLADRVGLRLRPLALLQGELQQLGRRGLTCPDRVSQRRCVALHIIMDAHIALPAWQSADRHRSRFRPEWRRSGEKKRRQYGRTTTIAAESRPQSACATAILSNSITR